MVDIVDNTNLKYKTFVYVCLILSLAYVFHSAQRSVSSLRGFFAFVCLLEDISNLTVAPVLYKFSCFVNETMFCN